VQRHPNNRCPFPTASDLRACGSHLEVPNWDRLEPVALLQAIRAHVPAGEYTAAIDPQEVASEVPADSMNAFLIACDSSPDTTFLSAEDVDRGMPHFWAAFQAPLRSVSMARDSTTNISEIFNRILVAERKRLPAPLLFVHMMRAAHKLHISLRKLLETTCGKNMHDDVLPLSDRMRKVIVVSEEMARHLQVVAGSTTYTHLRHVRTFDVRSTLEESEEGALHATATVNVLEGTCSCGFWQSEQIVCCHVTAGINEHLVSWKQAIAPHLQPAEFLLALQSSRWHTATHKLPTPASTGSTTSVCFPRPANQPDRPGRKKEKRYLSLMELLRKRRNSRT